MKTTLVILIIALVAKDTSQLNDPYVMRGIAQGLCLIVGALWLLQNFSLGMIRSYWPVFGYLTALLLTSLTATVSQGYILLQVLSLAAVLLFFVAYFNHASRLPTTPTAALINTTVVAYAIVAVLSLIVIYTHPNIAYGSLFNGDAGFENRFRGLFPKSGMLASAAGLTIGWAWFSRYSIVWKGIIIAVCVACLLLTLSRTFWIALLGGLLITYWLYAPQARKWVVLMSLLFVPLMVAQKAFNVEIDINKARFARAETFSTLNGRIGLWEQGLEAFKRSPVTGYGYTAGATGLQLREKTIGGIDSAIDEGRGLGKTTLHSGYLQSLLDSGILGTFFYLSVLMVAVYRLYRLDVQRRYRAEFFALIYLAIANITQNVVYSASVYDSIVFFAVAIFAMSLQRTAVPLATGSPAYHLATGK